MGIFTFKKRSKNDRMYDSLGSIRPEYLINEEIKRQQDLKLERICREVWDEMREAGLLIRKDGTVIPPINDENEKKLRFLARHKDNPEEYEMAKQILGIK